VGEVLSTAARITPGDFGSWTTQWLATARRVHGTAEQCRKRGHAVSAREAASASETQQPSWSSQMARGYLMACHAFSGMAAIAARIGPVTENRAPRAEESVVDRACSSMRVGYDLTRLPAPELLRFIYSRFPAGMNPHGDGQDAWSDW
jgi:hypothetical protein